MFGVLLYESELVMPNTYFNPTQVIEAEHLPGSCITLSDNKQLASRMDQMSVVLVHILLCNRAAASMPVGESLNNVYIKVPCVIEVPRIHKFVIFIFKTKQLVQEDSKKCLTFND